MVRPLQSFDRIAVHKGSKHGVSFREDVDEAATRKQRGLTSPWGGQRSVDE